jgi:hypothetical protein
MTMPNLTNEVEHPLLDAPQLLEPYVEHILALTAGMVRNALHDQWYELMDRMDERAQAMQQLTIMAADSDSRIVAALGKAVAESERAMNTIMAHAIASARWQGAEHYLRS